MMSNTFQTLQVALALAANCLFDVFDLIKQQTQRPDTLHFKQLINPSLLYPMRGVPGGSSSDR